MTRFNLISPRPGKDDRTHWHKIGSGFSRDKGGFSLIFDSLPLPDKDGRVTVLMTEPLPEDNAPRRDQARQSPAGYGAGGRPDLDDEVPFNMEWR